MHVPSPLAAAYPLLVSLPLVGCLGNLAPADAGGWLRGGAGFFPVPAARRRSSSLLFISFR